MGTGSPSGNATRQKGGVVQPVRETLNDSSLNPLRVACLQMRSGLDSARNLGAIAEAAERAASQGATYLLTPEVSIVFAANRSQLAAQMPEGATGAMIDRLSEIASQNGIHLHVGSMATPLADGRFANRSLLFSPDGALIAQYDKIHLYDADPPGDRPYRESETYRPGNKAVLASIGPARIGLTICYDLRFPALYAALANAGAGIMAVPAAFTVPTGKAHWESLLRARAIETGSFIVAAAQGGEHENGRRTWGRSMIVDPWGTILAQAGADEPELIRAELDLSRVADARARVPALANARPFSLSVN